MNFRRQKFGQSAQWYDSELIVWMGKTSWLNPGNRKYFLNKLELEFARRLKIEETMNEISGWERLTLKDSWDFNLRSKKPFRANSRATWDFKFWVHKPPNYETQYRWVECKGFFKPEDIIKLKRALKLYPERPLFCYTERFGLEPAQMALDRELKRWKKKKEQKKLVDKLFKEADQ